MMNRKTYVHTYVMLLLRDKGLSQVSLAEKAACSAPAINQILLGKRVSARIQQDIAEALGYPSWKRLDDAALFFSDNFKTMYNRPTPQRNSLKGTGEEVAINVG